MSIRIMITATEFLKVTALASNQEYQNVNHIVSTIRIFNTVDKSHTS